MAKKASRDVGRLTYEEFHSVFLSARLHEVPSICTPYSEPLHTAWLLHSAKTDSICHGLQQLTRVTTHALVEPSALAPLQARNRRQEAEREVLALLNLVRENREAVQDAMGRFQAVLDDVSRTLYILQPGNVGSGNEELMNSWAFELAQLRRATQGSS